tara:strand:+ start:20143 stop:22185 length:2043 start_codon:yes stop_codon:yes gene_type:complete
MYMNCAVVDIVPKGASKRDIEHVHSTKLDARDVARTNAAAQRALASYPPLFVANLASINDCVTKETFDVVFDNPGRRVAFADGESGSAKPSFRKGLCTGRGSKSAGSSSSSSSPPSSPQGQNSGGNNGQWQDSSSPSSKCDLGDGKWHPECSGNSNNQNAVTTPDMSGMDMGQAKPTQQPSQQVAFQQTPQDVRTGKTPSAKVQKELAAYLATLYSGNAPSRRRNVTPTQQYDTAKHVAEPVAKGRLESAIQQDEIPVPKAEALVPKPPSRHQGATTTYEAPAREFADMAGEDGPSDHLFDELYYSPEYYDDYDDLYFTSRSAAACKQVKRSTEGCASPNRWVKRSDCDWACERKGRAAKRSRSTEVIEGKLDALEKKIAKLVQLAEKKKHSSRSTPSMKKRDDILPTDDASSDDLAPAPTSLELFLVYLNNLQDKVIECTRTFAAILPSARTAVPAEETDDDTGKATPPKQARQLVAPDMASLPPYDWPAILGISANNIANKPIPWGSAYDDAGADLLPGDVTPAGSAQAAWLADLARNSHKASTAPTPSLAKAAEPTDSASPSTDAQQQWTNSLLAAQQQNTPSQSPAPLSPAAAAFPYFMGPGPVVPPGMSIDWPGPNNPGEGDLFQPGAGNLEKMPMLVDDLGPGSEEEVRKWFEEVGEKYDGDGGDGGDGNGQGE